MTTHQTLVDLQQLVDAVDELLFAIDNEGSYPEYHRAIILKHRHEWPTLWAAIDSLRKERDEVTSA